VTKDVEQKQHKIVGQPVQVKCFYECLGTSGGYDLPVVVPSPYSFKPSSEDELFKLNFLCRNEMFKLLCLEFEPAKGRAQKKDGPMIEVSCTLQKKIAKDRRKMPTWSQEINKIMSSQLELLEVQRRTVDAQVWESVSAELDCIERGEGISINTSIQNEIVVYGKRDFVQKTVKTVDEIIANANKMTHDNARKWQLRRWEKYFLEDSTFLQEMRKHMKIIISDDMIELDGNTEEIQAAKQKIKEYTSSTKEDWVSFEVSWKPILENTEATLSLLQMMKQKKVHASWEVKKHREFAQDKVLFVNVYGERDQDVEQAVTILKDAIVTELCRVCPETALVLNTNEGQAFKMELEKVHRGLLYVSFQSDRETVCMTGLREAVETAKPKLETFLNENTMYVQVFSSCGSLRQQILCTLLGIEQQATLLKELGAEIKLLEAGTQIQVKGTQNSLEKARIKLEEMEKQVCMKREKTVNSDIKTLKFINSDKCKEELMRLAKENKCVFGWTEDRVGLQVCIADVIVARVIFSGITKSTFALGINPFTASCENAMTLSVPGVPASCEKFPHSGQLNF
jgi:hypothetical protein